MSNRATTSKQQTKTAPGAALTLDTMPQRLMPAEVAAYLAVSTEHVMRFRDTGELEFINVGSPGAKTPSWRITRDSLAAFEQRRQTAKKK